MRENPRPTRHLEHIEPGRVGKPLPRSVGGPAWDLVPLPDPPVHGEPTWSGDAHGGDPAASPGTGSRKRLVMVVGGAVAVILALTIGGLTVLGEDRPEDVDNTTAAERAALELPFIAPDEPASDPAGPARQAETQARRTDAAEAGDDAVVSLPGGTTAGTETGQGGAIESDAGTGSSTGTGSTGGDGPGTGDGGTTTPTATPPPPTSDPTTKPTPKPTPEPTPSPTREPSPEPTPSPTVSPSPEPTGAPVAQGTGW